MITKKTYKLFIGGKFPRSESGRVNDVLDQDGHHLANLSQASRKDFRESVVAARKALPGWAGASSFLRGQILYRIAEMLDGRRAQFEQELEALGYRDVAEEVQDSIDLLIHYAGWCDKYQALFSSVNPVASSHFNFSSPQTTGIVAVAPAPGLLGLVSAIAPIIVGGNACIAHTDLVGISFAEVIATSDVPGGVVNLLTGERAELLPEFASHMDVNGILLCSDDCEERRMVELESAENLKRVSLQSYTDLKADPYLILAFQEVKTTWHPIGV